MADDPAITILDADEPDYGTLAARYEDRPNLLLEIADSGDPLAAARSVYIAGAIAREHTAHQVSDDAKGDLLDAVYKVVLEGSRNEDATVRVAAAIAAAALPEVQGATITTHLLRDDDIGVRKSALEGVPKTLSPEVVTALHEIAANHTELADLAQHVLDHHPPNEGTAPL